MEIIMVSYISWKTLVLIKNSANNIKNNIIRNKYLKYFLQYFFSCIAIINSAAIEIGKVANLTKVNPIMLIKEYANLVFNFDVNKLKTKREKKNIDRFSVIASDGNQKITKCEM